MTDEQRNIALSAIGTFAETFQSHGFKPSEGILARVAAFVLTDHLPAGTTLQYSVYGECLALAMAWMNANGLPLRDFSPRNIADTSNVTPEPPETATRPRGF